MGGSCALVLGECVASSAAYEVIYACQPQAQVWCVTPILRMGSL